MIIKFNLLKLQKKEEPVVIEKRITFIKVYLVLLALTLAGIVGAFFYYQTEIKSLEKEKAEKEQKLKEYQVLAQKVKQLEEENEEIKKRITTILSLKKLQGQKLKVIDSIFSSIGNNKILFSNLILESSRASFKALSVDLEYIANYLNTLESNKELFKYVELKKTVQQKKGVLNYIEFETEVGF